MKYNLFLFDLDDTLLDFKASERLSFFLALQSLGVKTDLEKLFGEYQIENRALWKLFEENKTTKEHLKVERFRKIFQANGIGIDPKVASERYLDTLPETVVLIDFAVEICDWLKGHGEIGILTNGIESVQHKRIKNSKLAPYINFISVSEECGYAKPDVRFFEYSAKKASAFTKHSAILVGDREEADILGAHNFGMDSCWFNPDKKSRVTPATPTFEIKHLSELKKLIST